MKFENLNKRKGMKDIYTHFTCATDTNNIQVRAPCAVRRSPLCPLTAVQWVQRSWRAYCLLSRV